MVNYKPRYPETIEVGGFTHPLKSTETPIVLLNQTALTTAGISMHSSVDVAYTVPTGKVFQPLGFKIAEAAGPRIMTLEQSDDEDASTNGVTKFVYLATSASLRYDIGFPEIQTILAGKYVNVKVNSASSPPKIWLMYGIEYEA